MYRNLRQIQPMGSPPEEYENLGFRGGVRFDLSPRELEPHESPEMEGMDNKGTALVKAAGDVVLGSAASSVIRAIADHAFINVNGVTQNRVLRLFVSGGSLVIQRLSGSSWVADSSISASVQSGSIRVASIQGILLIAVGNDNVLARIEDVTRTRSQVDVFPSGVLTDPSDTLISLTPSETAIGGYRLSYSVEAEIVEGTALEFSIVVRKGTTIVASRTYRSTGDAIALPNEELAFETDVTGNFTVAMGTLTVTDGPGFTFESRASGTFVDAEQFEVPRWRAAKNHAGGATGDAYTYTFNLIYGGTPGNDPVEVLFYARPESSGAWTLVGSWTYQNPGVGLTRTFTIPNLGENAQFGIHAADDDPNDPDWEFSGSVSWQEPIPPESSGAEIEIDPKDLRYSYEEYTEGPVIERFTSAPEAFWVDSFADRAIALWDSGDSQILSLSVSGNVEDWDGFGSDQLLLIDTRTDPIDALRCTAPLGGEYLAIFRSRSIMRAFRTGDPRSPVGVQHWLEGVGTDSPFSAVATPLGVLFLGHDEMVYILTLQGAFPVGAKIRPRLQEFSYSRAEVHGAYDSRDSIYRLGIGGAHIFEFDLEIFQTTNEPVWRYRSQAFQVFETSAQVS